MVEEQFTPAGLIRPGYLLQFCFDALERRFVGYCDGGDACVRDLLFRHLYDVDFRSFWIYGGFLKWEGLGCLDRVC